MFTPDSESPWTDASSENSHRSLTSPSFPARFLSSSFELYQLQRFIQDGSLEVYSFAWWLEQLGACRRLVQGRKPGAVLERESGSSRHGAVMNWWYPAAGAEGIQGRAGTTEGVPRRTEEY